jgi:WD40 repeat protein
VRGTGVLIATSMLLACPRDTVVPIDPAPPVVDSRAVDTPDRSDRPPKLVRRVDDVALTPDGRSLWLCADGRVRRWTWATEVDDVFEAECPRGLRLSTDGSTVVTPGDRTLSIHSSPRRDEARRIDLGLAPEDRVVDVALSARGRRVAVTTESGTVKTVDLPSGRVRGLEVAVRPGAMRSSADDSTFGRLDVDREIAPPQLGWSSDESRLVLVAAMREVEAERVRARVFLWDVDDGTHRASEPFEVLDRRLRGHLAMAISPADRRIAVGTAEGAIRLFDLHRMVWASPAATAYPTALAFSTDARRLAVAYADGAVRIFGPVGTADALELWPDARDTTSMAFSAGGERLVLGVHEGPVVIIDTSTGETVARIAVLDRGWVAVSAGGSVDGDRIGLEALRHGSIADVLGWDRGQLPAPHHVAGLIGELL